MFAHNHEYSFSIECIYLELFVMSARWQHGVSVVLNFDVITIAYWIELIFFFVRNGFYLVDAWKFEWTVSAGSYGEFNLTRVLENIELNV